MAPWESGQPWELGRQSCGCRGQGDCQPRSPRGGAAVPRDWLDLLSTWLLGPGICSSACSFASCPPKALLGLPGCPPSLHPRGGPRALAGLVSQCPREPGLPRAGIAGSTGPRRPGQD